MNQIFRPGPLLRPLDVSPVLEAARAAAKFAFDRGADHDHDGAFPEDEIQELHRVGLLAAILPRCHGGGEIAWPELCATLRRIGSGSLPLGRLYEGHVNALGLVMRFGSARQIESAAEEARQGQLFGVWNTDDAQGLHLVKEQGGFRFLKGRKILASGAGRVRRPLVTAMDAEGRRFMVMPRLDDARRADLSQWTAQGMRASATGAVDFSGIGVDADDILGENGDYERQPYFSGGAWRFCAVMQGGMETLLHLLRRHLVATQRGGDPHQAARFGASAIAVETARLWVERAARRAEEETSPSPENVVAYVNLARLAVERAGLNVMEAVQRSIGLQSFMRPNPIERFGRDLATYLRQPAPDRALTSAAAWMLAQEEASIDLWD